VRRFVKAELRWADLIYEKPVAKLREMGFEETKISVQTK
jgi:hypothetical protein